MTASNATLTPTAMFAEAGETSAVLTRQFARNASSLHVLGSTLRSRAPRALVTLGRGSSDHACTYAKYLIESRLGIVAASGSPGMSSIYNKQLDMNGTLCIAVSQSGKSPDLLSAAEAAKASGALLVALVNVESSPLARIADAVVPLYAGPEVSVAATKSYLASLAAIAHLVGEWSQDEVFLSALAALPAQMSQAWQLDWSPVAYALRDVQSLYVIGRGVGLSAAQEMALKFKETCRLHAEAFSAAEVRHGPMALVRAGFPALVLGQRDESLPGVEGAAADLHERGANVFSAGPIVSPGAKLAFVETHAALQPLALTQTFYRMVEQLARLRGLDPDRPPHLNKVTETV